ncbi:MAG TPA: cytochrome c biogenesis protein CcsA [Spirochaetales bacterium]|nr:cytochrome c biogenesis protein CcsA [Spirochaetales bacterium]
MSPGATFANIAFLTLLAAAAIQALRLLRKGAAPDPVSHWLLLAASTLLVAALAVRSFAISFVALTGTWESLSFWAAAVGLVIFAWRLRGKPAFRPGIAFGATLAAIVMLSIASSPLIPKDALPPIPALRSAWLLLHVGFAFVGEAFFVASFVAALLLLAAKDERRRVELDRVVYTAIAIGYPIFTAGALVFGAIWAERAWGRWWSWDPKETWALVTWLVYSAYLHVRLVMKRKDSLPAVLAVAGFLCALFTFFGVNYLLPGLHSYG